MSIRRYISTDFYRHNTDRKTMFWRHKNTVFCFVNTIRQVPKFMETKTTKTPLMMVQLFELSCWRLASVPVSKLPAPAQTSSLVALQLKPSPEEKQRKPRAEPSMLELCRGASCVRWKQKHRSRCSLKNIFLQFSKSIFFIILSIATSSLFLTRFLSPPGRWFFLLMDCTTKWLWQVVGLWRKNSFLKPETHCLTQWLWKSYQSIRRGFSGFCPNKTREFVPSILCFHPVKPMFSPRQSYVFRSHMCHFGSHKVTPRRQQSATSTGNKSHIDGHKVPHRRATSPTSTGSKSHIDRQQVPHRQRRGCSPPRTAMKYLYTHPFSPLPISTFFAKTPHHLTQHPAKPDTQRV